MKCKTCGYDAEYDSLKKERDLIWNDMKKMREKIDDFSCAIYVQNAVKNKENSHEKYCPEQELLRLKQRIEEMHARHTRATKCTNISALDLCYGYSGLIAELYDIISKAKQ